MVEHIDMPSTADIAVVGGHYFTLKVKVRSSQPAGSIRLRTIIRWRSPSNTVFDRKVFDQEDELTDIVPGVDYIVNFAVPVDFNVSDLGVWPIEAVSMVSGNAAGATGHEMRFSQSTQRFPVVLDGSRLDKEGHIVYSNEFDLPDTGSCVALTPGERKPMCGASDPENGACCPGLRCAMTRSGHNKCFVNAVAGVRRPEGAPCSKHNQCEHRCDKSLWVCDGASRLSRSRRAIEAEAADADDVEAATGDNSFLNIAAGTIGGFFLVIGAVVGRRRLAAVRGSGGAATADDMTGLAETSLSPAPRVTLAKGDKTPSRIFLGVL